MNSDNLMRNIRIEKITLNVGAGKDELRLKRGIRLLKNITGVDPVKTITSKRIPTWGLRPGVVVGCKVTLRGGKAEDLLRRLLEAKENLLSGRQFDASGNFSFGIEEYIDIPGVEYDPEIKIMGLEVAVTLERPGFRIKRRKYGNHAVPKKHTIDNLEAVKFMKENYNVSLAEEA